MVNGVATNGRLHPDMNPELAYIFTDTLDNMWNTPFSTRPDSIAGWFKYAPQGNDTLQVKGAERGAIHSHAGTGTYVSVSILEKEE